MTNVFYSVIYLKNKVSFDVWHFLPLMLIPLFAPVAGNQWRMQQGCSLSPFLHLSNALQSSAAHCSTGRCTSKRKRTTTAVKVVRGTPARPGCARCTKSHVQARQRPVVPSPASNEHSTPAHWLRAPGWCDFGQFLKMHLQQRNRRGAGCTGCFQSPVPVFNVSSSLTVALVRSRFWHHGMPDFLFFKFAAYGLVCFEREVSVTCALSWKHSWVYVLCIFVPWSGQIKKTKESVKREHEYFLHITWCSAQCTT